MKKTLGYLALCLLSISVYAQEKDSAPNQPILNPEQIQNAIPAPLPYSRTGNPDTYVVNGKTYHVLPTNQGYDVKGYASWYGTKFQGKKTSSGEPYNMYAMTAASPTLPIPSFVKVTNLQNHKSVIVKVNDRGPFHDNRILDLSYAAATKLDMLKNGTALVQVVAIDTGAPAPHLMPQHFLQVAAFSNGQYAEQFAQKVQTLVNAPVKLTTHGSGSSLKYRVLVGPMDQNQVNTAQNILSENGLNKGFIV